MTGARELSPLSTPGTRPHYWPPGPQLPSLAIRFPNGTFYLTIGRILPSTSKIRVKSSTVKELANI